MFVFLFKKDFKRFIFVTFALMNQDIVLPSKNRFILAKETKVGTNWVRNY